MGFTEFQNVHRHVSQRLLGINIDFENSEEEGSQYHDDDDSSSVDSHHAEVRERFKSGVKKVVLMNRFIKASRQASKYSLEYYARSVLYSVASRVFSAPLEIAFIRSASGVAMWQHPLQMLKITPLLAAQSLIVHSVENLDSYFEHTRKPIVGFVISRILSYPFELMFCRNAVLGQPLGWPSQPFNSFSVFAFVDTIERVVGKLYSRKSTSKPNFGQWLLWTSARFLLTIPLTVMRQFALVSNPDGDSPFSLSPLETITGIIKERGIMSLFHNMLPMMSLMPPMVVTFVVSQLFVRYVVGPGNAEKFEDQVQSAKESLMLKSSTPIEVENQRHLEDLVYLADKYDRLLVLAGLEPSHTEAAEAARYLAANTECVVIIGNPRQQKFIKQLAQGHRSPYFLPIIKRSVYPGSCVTFKPEGKKSLIEAMNKMLQEMKTSS